MKLPVGLASQQEEQASLDMQVELLVSVSQDLIGRSLSDL
jgi:hypothetical protein